MKLHVGPNAVVPLSLMLIAGIGVPGMARANPLNPGGMSAGIVIGIDPDDGHTGMLTADQMARLTAKLHARAEQASARPAPVVHADGRVSMDARGWMREFSIVRLGANGRVVFDCVDGPDDARHLMRQTPPTGPEER